MGSGTEKTIDRAQVLHIAKLARLTLREDEIPPLTDQLVKILGHIAQLSEANTEGVEPTTQVGVDQLPLRPDVVETCLAREVVFASAPETVGNCFAVPTFVEE